MATSEESVIADVSASVDEFIASEGWVPSQYFPDRRGSWFRELWAKTITKVSQPEVQKQLEEVGEKARYTIELASLQKHQAEVNKVNAEAVKNLIESMKDSDGILHVGSVLIVKTTPPQGMPLIAVRTLTSQEMIYLERHQDLLMKPHEILGCLSQIAKSADSLPELTIG